MSCHCHEIICPKQIPSSLKSAAGRGFCIQSPLLSLPSSCVLSRIDTLRPCELMLRITNKRNLILRALYRGWLRHKGSPQNAVSPAQDSCSCYIPVFFCDTKLVFFSYIPKVCLGKSKQRRKFAVVASSKRRQLTFHTHKLHIRLLFSKNRTLKSRLYRIFSNLIRTLFTVSEG
jgi:hypothetical protein